MDESIYIILEIPRSLSNRDEIEALQASDIDFLCVSSNTDLCIILHTEIMFGHSSLI
jgi:hypothetical protein